MKSPKKPRTKTNLAEKMDEEELAALGSQICQWYEVDLASRSDWEAMRTEWFSLWLSQPDPKRIPPFPGGSNVGLPLTASACSQFSSRAYASIFEAPDVVKIMPTEINDIGRADRVQDYMNWQIRGEMKEYEEEMDLLITALPIEGTVFKKVFFCTERNRPVTEFISGMDVILPYSTKKLRNARRVTQRYWRHAEDLYDAEDAGFFTNVDLVCGIEDGDEDSDNPMAGAHQRGGSESETRSSVEELSNQAQGLGGAGASTENEHLILECSYKDPRTRKPMLAWVDHATGTVLRLTKREWHGKPIRLFSDYHFIRNPYGFYSFGFGHFLKPLNRIGESVFNLTIDSARLSNQPFGFYGRRAGFKSRRIELFPGSMTEVEDASQVYFPNMQRVDQSVFQLMGMVDRYVETFTSNSEVMSGRQQKGVREPTARGTMALIEQGMVSFGTLTKRLHACLRGELEMILKLNEMHVPPEKTFRVLGTTSEDGGPTFGSVGSEDFETSYDIYPTADPSYASNAQRRAEASQIMDIALRHPLLGLPNQETGEVANPGALQKVTKDWLKTYGKGELADLAFPTDPKPIMDPFKENAAFIQGIKKSVVDGEDLLLHRQVHIDFRDSPYGRTLPEDVKEILNEHIKETESKLYLAQQALGDVSANAARGGAGMPGPSPQPPEEEEEEPQFEEGPPTEQGVETEDEFDSQY